MLAWASLTVGGVAGFLLLGNKSGDQLQEMMLESPIFSIEKAAADGAGGDCSCSNCSCAGNACDPPSETSAYVTVQFYKP